MAIMNGSRALRKFLLAPPALGATLLSTPQLTLRTPSRPYSALQGVSQTSFWKSLIPKPLRKAPASPVKRAKSKEWNPATFFIVIFLLIGSMSIQMIALRNESDAFSRRADAKIGLLKEIIERIQNGEEVDVEGLLGTGNAVKEREWEEGMFEASQMDRRRIAKDCR
jgi:hypothetical protein